MLNEFKFIGRIARDLELTTKENMQARCNFALAVNNAYGTDFLNITAFDKTAENLVKYNQKGDMVYVEGYVSTNKKSVDGVDKYYMNLIANRIVYLSNKKVEESENEIEHDKENLDDLTSDDKQNTEVNENNTTFQKAKGFVTEDLPF
ncbi:MULTISPECIES: single-stranded DNA-binding protein [Staphylococcus]|uniref:single-stranded DNA-binding protein n=1 Tax=Staphylococcus TaxID=1279 RepID=UPI001953A09B|nr:MULTISPECIES: single-stranded DNA-binding protein [Staphylococcus]MCT2553853.1 single-stranded DNA-binding protein [Staphylococcus aureus]MCT2569013.1 single-stranded DNA-binding protein [Staphylococcus aureus]MCT2572851.1 single-stranded DNA-binding protein [Staphylococcus aureus]MCT2575582.1 single-stranded DNA-binding protein [Staphylococcus aureus]MEA1207899.1 single-stranded DNA-binding protein [Staphylococcus aureus]